MQLSDAAPCTGSVRAALAAATAALLAPAITPASAQSNASPAWRGDSALLVYAEGGGRVRAVEPVVSLKRTDGNDQTLGLKVTFDALTGASPNGAAPQPAPQTFTSPSGESTYVVGAGRTPLDTSFHDARGALAFTLERPFGDGRRLALGANLSAEYDFRSFGLNAALAQDFNDKNTTVSLGAAVEADRIRAVGGAPQGLRPAFVAGTARSSSASRNVVDLLLGVTQVMSRQWLTQLNLGWGRGSGDHTDPYKVLSVVDAASGLVTGDRYVTELRPDSRSRLSLYWQNKIHLRQDVLDVSYRFYRDDWGVRAHTLDARWRVELGGGQHIEPQLRWYRQSAADFWRPWLVEGQGWSSTAHGTGLASASADPRLAAFTGQTLGLKFGMPLDARSELAVRAQVYRQTQKTPANAPGVLQTLDTAPTLKAATLVVGYTRDF
ncbi:MAG: DUF3570 domain-containing protein [Burkholderiaceae bacterium]